jgi:hypothetical protein
MSGGVSGAWAGRGRGVGVAWTGRGRGVGLMDVDGLMGLGRAWGWWGQHNGRRHPCGGGGEVRAAPAARPRPQMRRP